MCARANALQAQRRGEASLRPDAWKWGPAVCVRPEPALATARTVSKDVIRWPRGVLRRSARRVGPLAQDEGKGEDQGDGHHAGFGSLASSGETHARQAHAWGVR